MSSVGEITVSIPTSFTIPVLGVDALAVVIVYGAILTATLASISYINVRREAKKSGEDSDVHSLPAAIFDITITSLFWVAMVTVILYFSFKSMMRGELFE